MKYLLPIFFLLSPSIDACEIDFGEWLINVDSTFTEWHGVYDAHSKYIPDCESAAYGVSFGNAIVNLASRESSGIRELSKYIDNNPKFKSFVLRHIDFTASEKDLYQLSNKVCMKSNRDLCQAVVSRAREAYTRAISP